VVKPEADSKKASIGPSNPEKTNGRAPKAEASPQAPLTTTKASRVRSRRSSPRVESASGSPKASDAAAVWR